MKIYLVDDEKIILNGELEIIKECCPNDEVIGFSSGKALVSKAKEKMCDIAFLDINLGDTSGVNVAKQLKDINPNVNIIFLTAHDKYFREAMELRASGYILKPLERSNVINELNNLRYNTGAKNAHKVKATCLGNFEVRLMDGSPIRFERSKSKEALAYLIHLHGSSCTIRELAAIIFEDEPFDHKNQMYIQKIISSLMKSLKAYGIEDIIEKEFNSLSVNTAFIECDYYDYLEKNKGTRFQKPYVYMEQYSWGMF